MAFSAPRRQPLYASHPHTRLARLPTPVHEAVLPGTGRLLIKRDDVSGVPYGGNKVRKLEFLLGRAMAAGADAVITFGAAGSNHALATAIYAKLLGLRCHSMLVPQVNARSICRNLLRGYAAGARLHPCANRRDTALCVASVFRETYARSGRYPHVIPPGGSSPVGALGFVNAAFELADQVPEEGMPDVIYLPSGTMGTCVGLLLGLRLRGLETRIEAVSVTTAPFSCMEKAKALFQATNRLLHAADPSLPLLAFPHHQFSFRKEFLGAGYGIYTTDGVAAVRQAGAIAGIRLEGTYTGKAFAALLADARRGALDGKRVLFWNTYNGRDFGADIEGLDYRELPIPFHAYFEQDVQPLDQV